jgi:outer membrane protein TolC
LTSRRIVQISKADYTEVLLTQREALEAKMELAEIKMKQLNATINLYKALGGGWKEFLISFSQLIVLL